MSIQFWQVLLTALLPVFSTVVAGVARQDKASPILNDFISFLMPLAAGFGNTFAYGGFTNANSLLLLGGSTLWASLSHADLLMRAQEYLQSKVLSLGVRPATLQAIEGFVEHTASIHMPQLEALLMRALDEVRSGHVMPAQPTPAPAPQFKQPVLQPLLTTFPATLPPAYGNLFPVTSNAPDTTVTFTAQAQPIAAPTTPDPFSDTNLTAAVTPPPPRG